MWICQLISGLDTSVVLRHCFKSVSSHLYYYSAEKAHWSSAALSSRARVATAVPADSLGACALSDAEPNPWGSPRVQVAAKSGALSHFLRGLPAAPGAYAQLQLAGRLVAQCECQVALSHAFAFPLAEVAAAVAADHPAFLPILLAKLHHVRACFGRGPSRCACW